MGTASNPQRPPKVAPRACASLCGTGDSPVALGQKSWAGRPCHKNARARRMTGVALLGGRISVALIAAVCLLMAPGCTSPRGVPSGAQLVTEATVKGSFQAPTDGMLWIFRSAGRGSKGQLHYSGPIGAGQVLVIDPSMNKATIDGRELELVLPGGDVWYQAYFRPDRSVGRVIDERPPGGRVDPGYREIAPAESAQSAPPDQAPADQQNSE